MCSLAYGHCSAPCGWPIAYAVLAPGPCPAPCGRPVAHVTMVINRAVPPINRWHTCSLAHGCCSPCCRISGPRYPAKINCASRKSSWLVLSSDCGPRCRPSSECAYHCLTVSLVMSLRFLTSGPQMLHNQTQTLGAW